MVKQTNQQSELLARLGAFCSATEDVEHRCLHKLLGARYQSQLDMLREMLSASLYDDAIHQWFTDIGFKSIMALLGTNGQGIGTR